MNQPHLYLLSRGNLAPEVRAKLIQDMISATEQRRVQPDALPAFPRHIMIISGKEDQGLDELIEGIRQHPQLATADLRLHTNPSRTDIGEHELLVFTPGAMRDGHHLRNALSAGVPVLIPDSEHADCLQDGVNIFHYRAGDSDRLALCLLGMTLLPRDGRERIVARAHAALDILISTKPQDEKDT